MIKKNKYTCRVCGNRGLELQRASTVTNEITSNNFAISDFQYGATLAIYKCSECELVQCPEISDILPFYEQLEDNEYENERKQRYLQAEKLIDQVLAVINRFDGDGLALLDVGAGSGILVEAAKRKGFTSVGVEPSSWLVNIANSYGLNVYEGTLPHVEISNKFDIIMLIDVIEHVSDPLDLLKHIKNQLSPKGLVFIVTPDSASLAARILGYRWWHFRIAHISYFTKSTLKIISTRAGLKPTIFKRPGWYFTYKYLHQRLCCYVPWWLIPPPKGPLGNAIIPLNLGDSLLMVCVIQ